MNDGVVSTDEVPTEWPRKLYPPPATYHYDHARIDVAKIRAQGLARYRRDPAKWNEAVRRWQAANPEYVAAYRAWYHRQNRERRLIEMREYTRKWRIRKRQGVASVTATAPMRSSPTTEGIQQNATR